MTAPLHTIVTADNYPHGLRCAWCHTELPPGSIHTEQLVGVDREGDVHVDVTCLRCEGKEVPT